VGARKGKGSDHVILQIETEVGRPKGGHFLILSLFVLLYILRTAFLYVIPENIPNCILPAPPKSDSNFRLSHENVLGN